MSTDPRGRTWAIVLAAGDGTRLKSLTTGLDGLTVPKQYCSVNGGPSLLRRAIRRAQALARPERVVVVVAEQHRAWWRRELADLEPANVIVQPRNRGTAPGALLPLLAVTERDPKARVVLLPSDHFVESEPTLIFTVRRALRSLLSEPGAIQLLGISPQAADTEYGWIVPGPGVPAAAGATSVSRDPSVSAASGIRARLLAGDPATPGAVGTSPSPARSGASGAAGSGWASRPVGRFVEKPGPALAEALRREGGLWNSFIVAGRGEALLALYRRRLPDLLGAFLGESGEAPRGQRLRSLYDGLATHDFSRELLQGSEADLRVMAVPQCGWTDLGTPARVAECLDQVPGAPFEGAFLPPVDLASAFFRRARLRLDETPHLPEVATFAPAPSWAPAASME